MLEKIRNGLILLALLTLALLPLPWPRNAYAAAPISITDVNLLEVLAQQHINPANVRLSQTANAEHPYSEVYISAKDNKAFQVFSQLPQANSEGQLIQPMWVEADNEYNTLVNTFQARVSETIVYLTCINDQADGRLVGQTLEWNPQIFVGDTEYTPVSATPTRLQTDPINSAYFWNTLEWDYQVCKRQLRLIEGSILESWVFTANPGDTVRIIHNQTGFYGLKLGSGADEVTTQDAVAVELPQIMTVRKQLAIQQQIELGGKIGGGKIQPLPVEPQPQPIADDVEVFYAESFGTATYPLTIGGSTTFYPDAHAETTSVDGFVYLQTGGSTAWATIRSTVNGTGADSSGNYISLPAAQNSVGWQDLSRAITLFDTSSLSGFSITAATLSLRGYSMTLNQITGASINIYSVTPTSDTNIVVGDYDVTKYGSTEYSSTKTLSSLSFTGYNDFALNAAGLGNINTAGTTRFSIRYVFDATNNPPWSGGMDRASYPVFYSSEKGIGYQPKLVVTYTTLEVLTLAATSVTSTSATLNGNVTSVAGGNATVRGFVYATSSHALPGNVAPAASGYSDNVSESGNYGTGNYSLAASSLSKYVTCYVRAFALNVFGYAYGGEVSFTTLHDAPTAVTNAATGVTAYSAVLNGAITDLGGYGACTQYKFDWGLGSGNYSVGTWTSDVGAYGLGAYDSDSHATGLIGNTTYHFIFSALNAYGWGVGNDTSFATLESIVTVVTVAVTDKTDTTAILKGNITNTGAGVVIRGVYWGTTSPPTHLASESGTWYTNGVYSLTVTGLTPDTVYYCQAHIQDIDGNTSSGAILSFLTLSNTWSNSFLGGNISVWSPVDSLPTQPTGWNLSTTPAFTNLQLPGVDFFTSVFSDSGYPVSFMWWLVLAIGITFLGILVYEVSNAVLVIFMLGILCLAVVCSMGWLDWWIIFPYVMWGLASLVVERQFGF